MPILNQSQNIPGMMVEFQDGGLSLRKDSSQNVRTRSVLILGTAIDGPIMTPVAVDSDTAEAIFGKGVKANNRPNGATLPEAFNQLYKEGCRDIRMMRVSGSVSSKEAFCATVGSSSLESRTEVLGLVGGNDEMVFTLNHDNIIADSVEVYAGGRLIIPAKYTVDAGLNTSEVTLEADACSVGVDVVIKYKYNTEAPVVFDASVTLDYNVIDNTLLLSQLPITGVNGVDELVISVDTGLGFNDFVLDVDYTIDGPFITFITPVDINTSSIKAVFSHYPVENECSPIVSQNSDSVGGDVWISEAANAQEFPELQDQPLDGQFKIYVGNREIFNTDAYEVDEIQKIVAINKEFFVLGEKVEFSYNFLSGDVVTPFIKIESIFGGEMYNECSLEVKNIYLNNNLIDKEILLKKPVGKRSSGLEQPLSYLASEYYTLEELVNAINTDARNNVFIAEVDEDFEGIDTLSLDSVTETAFANGDNGINLSKQTMFEKLSGKRDASGLVIEEGAYAVLQNYIVDMLVPLGVYADDKLLGKYDNFALELAYFCGIMSSIHMHLTHGIISTKPAKKNSIIDIENYVKKLEEYNNTYLMRDETGLIETNNDGIPFDMGQYISVLAGQEMTFSSPRLGIHSDTAVNKYAALLSILPAASAPTNKALESTIGLKQIYSNGQLNRLTALRFVTFKLRTSDSAVVATDGITASLASSDYSRVVHVNVIREILKEIHRVCEPFIGEPISPVTSNALASAIDKILSIKQNPQTGIISGYNFRIVHDESSILLGDTKLELNITPFSERRSITLVVGLKPSL
jgi:hypothetical protein